MSTDRYDVIVVGGGQAGLAMGYHLARRGHRFTILEAADTPAAAWRARWNSLRLFTPARYSSLPGLAFPGDPGHHPTRDEVVDYLTHYVDRFALPVELSSPVRALHADGDGYELTLEDRTLHARQVIVATGPFQVPVVPEIAAQLDAAVVQLHSVDYRDRGRIAAGPVLVVGGGNTGFQIAEELVDSHEVHLSIGSRQMPVPQRILGRDLFDVLTATGLMAKTTASRIGRRAQGREALVASSPRKARRSGVVLHPRATGADGSAVTFADGTQLSPATVLWATGFRRDDSWIDVPVFDEHGRVAHQRGVTSSPGLYFLGLAWQHTRGSALLGWVGDDAAHIAERVSDLAAADGPVEERTSRPSG